MDYMQKGVGYFRKNFIVFIVVLGVAGFFYGNYLTSTDMTIVGSLESYGLEVDYPTLRTLLSFEPRENILYAPLPSNKVVLVRNSDSAKRDGSFWDGQIDWITSPGKPYCTSNVNCYYHYYDRTTIKQMLDDAVIELSGEVTPSSAWNTLFPDYATSNKKIAIKVNNNAGSAGLDYNNGLNNIYDNNPAMIDALSDLLNQHLGANLNDIYFYDVSHPRPVELYKKLSADDRFEHNYYFGVFQGADNYFNDYGGTSAPIDDNYINYVTAYSDLGQADVGAYIFDDLGANPNYMPRVVSESDYIIDLALLKNHKSTISDSGTFSLKNQGLGTPQLNIIDGSRYGCYSRNGGSCGQNLHSAQLCAAVNANTHLRDKTHLVIIDGIYAQIHSATSTIGPADIPSSWSSFGAGEPPALILVGTDPVAIDSVANYIAEEEDVSSGTSDYYPDGGIGMDCAADAESMYGLGVYESYDEYVTNAGFIGIDYVILDQTATCTPGQQRNCPLQDGVCLGSQETCDAGGNWPGCDVSTYLSHNISYEDGIELSCSDTFDNDCDALTDTSDSDCFSCVINDVYWGSASDINMIITDIEEPSQVGLVVNSSGCTLGGQVSLAVNDDEAVYQPLSTILNITSNQVSYLWNSEWILDNDATPDVEEYIISAEIVSDPLINGQSAILNVNKDQTPPVFVDFDGNYVDVNIYPASNSATFEWETDENTNYSLSINESVDSFDVNIDQFHRTASVLGLGPNTQYSYDLTVCDNRENCNTDSGIFTTSEPISSITLDFNDLVDSKVSSTSPDYNWGAKGRLDMSSSTSILMKWNLAPYAGQTLQSALLRINNFWDGGDPSIVTIYPLNKYWTEGTGIGNQDGPSGATWNEYDYSGTGANSWDEIGGDINTAFDLAEGVSYSTNNSLGWKEFDIKPLIDQYGLDYGFVIMANHYFNVYVSEWANNLETPELVLNFVLGCTDDDGDGFNVDGGDCGPADCDDDPLQCGADCYPGNIEMCDGYDNDCSLLVDDEGDLLCDNGLFCDGPETCGGFSGCQVGIPPVVDDGVGCTNDSCDESTDSILHITNDGLCDDGLWCNGEDYCSATLDCQVQNVPDCVDSVSCTVDSCNETTDSCNNLPDDTICDDGNWCNGAETCDEISDCQFNTPPSCTDSCVDSDGGQIYLTFGSVMDNDLCTLGDVSCPSVQYDDTCIGDSITEYYCSGNDYVSDFISCDAQYTCNDNNFTCSVNTVFLNQYGNQYSCDNTGGAHCDVIASNYNCGQSLTCNAANECQINTGSLDCGVNEYTCYVTGGSWSWNTYGGDMYEGTGAFDCSDTFDNDCDSESDYDNQDGAHGDGDCSVSVLSANVVQSSVVENSNVDIECVVDVQDYSLNSVVADLDGTSCTGGGDDGFGTYQFTCNVGAGAGTRIATCGIDETSSYQSGIDQTDSVDVYASDCTGLLEGECSPNPLCDWCLGCEGDSGPKSNDYGGVSTCVPAGTCTYSCYADSCTAECSDGWSNSTLSCVGENVLTNNYLCDVTSCDIYLNSSQTEDCSQYNSTDTLQPECQEDVLVDPYILDHVFSCYDSRIPSCTENIFDSSIYTDCSLSGQYCNDNLTQCSYYINESDCFDTFDNDNDGFVDDQDGDCAVSFDISLNPGLNFISVPINVTNTSLEQLDAQAILAYDLIGMKWLLYYQRGLDEINALEMGRGYVVYSLFGGNVTLNGYGPEGYDYLLDANNWNLVGVTRQGLITDIYGVGIYTVWEYVAGSYVDVTDQELIPGVGYWVAPEGVYSPPGVLWWDVLINFIKGLF